MESYIRGRQGEKEHGEIHRGVDKEGRIRGSIK